MNSPKYSIGDEVWFMDNNKPIKEEIRGIYCRDTMGFNDLFYAFRKTEILKFSLWKELWQHESELFPSKEALIKSL